MPEQEYDRVQELLQTVLERVGQEQGAASGFVQRASKVTAALFVQMLVLGCWQEAGVTLLDWVRVGHQLGVQVTVAGLHQRLTGAAVELLRVVLRAALGVGQAVVSCTLFSGFAGVYLQDSTYLTLPAGLAGLYPGSGGAASPAGAKVVLNYEYRSGTIAALEVVAGRTADQGCRLTQRLAVPTSLHIFDLGFYALETLLALVQAGSYFLCRHQSQTALYSLAARPQRIDLLATLTACTTGLCEFEALLGAKTRIPVRIIAERLPAAAVAQRRTQLLENARRQRRTLAPLTLLLLEWNIFCTNVPATHWNGAQVIAAYAVRWQVELLFKLCKSQAGLDQFGNWHAPRILCQLYARLIALVLSQHLLAPLRFTDAGELSPPKAFDHLQHLIPHLILVIANRWKGLKPLLHALADLCLSLALKEKRTHRLTSYQQLSLLNP
jgi:hypothetical protein